MCLPWNVDLREAGSAEILEKMCRTGTSFFSFQKFKSHGGTYSGKRVSFPPGGVSSALFLTLA